MQVLGGAPPRLRDARRGRQLAPGDVEEELFGFPPFADPSSPTYLEAADRLVYGALNLWKVDGGNPHFGSVSTVFSNAYVRNASLIAAIDGSAPGCITSGETTYDAPPSSLYPALIWYAL